MDSANSGSLQSSSGGDDDFDSLSALFRSSSSCSAVPSGAAAAAAAAAQLLSSSNHHHHHLFDSIYLDPSSFLPFDTTTSASATASWSPAAGGPTQSLQPREVSATASIAGPPTQRSSKKRSRASRRTPTTVLTTDTANFRAMVQEFTGIPSAPFARTSRFHAFHSPAGAAFRSFVPPVAAAADASYLLRPLTQKLQTSAPFAATTSVAGISSMPSTTSSAAYPTGAGSSYQQHGLLLGSPNQSILSPRSPRLNFQSPLQPHLHATHAQPLPQAMPSTSEEYGGFAPGPAASPDITALRPRWNATTPAIAAEQVQLRSIPGQSIGLRQQRTSSCKMNLSSEVDVDKVAETASARDSRGDGTLESWICSSD